MDTELPNTKNIKISIDGSAELLTLNPLPRNFNYIIIIKQDTGIEWKEQ